ncbi:phosphate butyryltransferase [Ruegeria sediminis]|uniref:Phosphate butyryltransferase n=1 Tax=Ruegeria sediminis TaxID=2583820 RepID=A0ABY2WT00_9RHOB|nr:phosphate acyltransferase [Ruegeria sediminis]TMV04192.1 phosphate butyryltransferase [Ruegeria sediminis]
MADHIRKAGGMMVHRSFEDLRAAALQRQPIRLVVAGGEAPEIAMAVMSLIHDGLVSNAVVTGDPSLLAPMFPNPRPAGVEFRNAVGPDDCAREAVAAIREGLGDVLMKGHIDSTSYLRAVVDREAGLRAGGVLSNVTVAEMPSVKRLIAATDNGIVPAPTLDQKRQIIINTEALFRGLGVSPVRVAAVCATEKVSDAIPATRDAETLTKEGSEGILNGFLIGGPMGYDVAISTEAARIKGLQALPAAGSADLLLFPNIDAANAVAKAWKYHGDAKTGSIVLGGKVPVLLNSRSDSAERRINALLLAAAVMEGGRG